MEPTSWEKKVTPLKKHPQLKPNAVFSQKRKDRETYSFERHLQELFKLVEIFETMRFILYFIAASFHSFLFEDLVLQFSMFTLELARFQLPQDQAHCSSRKVGFPQEPPNACEAIGMISHS